MEIQAVLEIMEVTAIIDSMEVTEVMDIPASMRAILRPLKAVSTYTKLFTQANLTRLI